MPESLLQYILRIAGTVDAPVVPAWELNAFPIADVRSLTGEGVLQETATAEEIPRPARLGVGGPLLVRRAAGGIFGVADEGDYCTPITLGEEDVRQYSISALGLIQKIRRENGIEGIGLQRDDGFLHVGEKILDGGAMPVSLLLGHADIDSLLGRLKRLKGTGGERVLLTPIGVQQRTEHERLLRDDGVHILSLHAIAAENKLTVNWGLIRPNRMPAVATAKAARKRTTGSPEAVVAVQTYMAAKALNRAEFSVQAGMTEPTLRRFLEDGEMQRSSFKLMAERIGLTPEALLRGELPPGISRPGKR